MSIRLFVVCLLLVMLTVGGQASEGPALDDLEWLAGHWSSTGTGIEIEEIWTEPAGGLMLGLHRAVSPGKPAFFEYLRIEQRDNAVVYIASPQGQGATEFVRVPGGENQAVFENPDHDFPKRISYRRVGDLLQVTIEGDGKTGPRRQHFEWRLED